MHEVEKAMSEGDPEKTRHLLIPHVNYVEWTCGEGAPEKHSTCSSPLMNDVEWTCREGLRKNTPLAHPSHASRRMDMRRGGHGKTRHLLIPLLCNVEWTLEAEGACTE